MPMLYQVAKPSEVVGQEIARKSSGLSATAGVANVEIMKMAKNLYSESFSLSCNSVRKRI